MAAQLKQDLGVAAELIVGTSGEFTVWVGDEVVAQKGPGGFPTEEEALAAVRRALVL